MLDGSNVADRRRLAEKIFDESREFNPDAVVCENDIIGMTVNGYRITSRICSIFDRVYYEAKKADESSTENVMIEHICLKENSYSDLYRFNSNGSVHDMLQKYADEYIEKLSDFFSTVNSEFYFDSMKYTADISREIHIISIFKIALPIYELRNSDTVKISEAGVKLVEKLSQYNENILLTDVNTWISPDGSEIYVTPDCMELKQKYFVITPEILYLKTFCSGRKYYCIGIIIMKLLNGGEMLFDNNDFSFSSFTKSENRRKSCSAVMPCLNMNNAVWKAAELMLMPDAEEMYQEILDILRKTD